MAIPAISITSRLSAYSCCAATAGYNWVLKEAIGDPCWKEERRRYLFLSWAMGVLSRYHIENDPCDCDGCVSEDFVNQVIALADPGCVKCACGTTTPPGDPCAISWDFEVLDTIVEADIASAPDGLYLQTDFGGNPSAVIIEVISGGANNPFVVPNGNIVYATDTDIYYSAFNNATTLLFPGISVGTIIQPGLFSIISDNAPYAFAQNRTIRIEGTTDNTTWVTLYNGQEQDISMPLEINTFSIMPNPVNFRIVFIEGSCEYGPVDATTFNNTPPFNYVLAGTTAAFPLVNPVTTQAGTLFGTFTTEDSINDPSGGGPPNGIIVIRKADDLPANLVSGLRYGLVRRSADAGQTWAVPAGSWSVSPYVTDPLTAEFAKISYVTGGTFFIAGIGGVLMRSPNYGLAINYLDQTGLSGADVRSVAGIDADTFVVGTADAGIFRSTDGGATYTQDASAAAITDPVVHMERIDDVILAFTTAGVYRSTDAGVTWPAFPNTAITTGEFDRIDSDVVGQRVFVGCANGRYLSTDAGQTWTLQSADVVLALSAITANVVLYVTTNNEVVISTDAGITVSPMSIGGYNGYALSLETHVYF